MSRNLAIRAGQWAYRLLGISYSHQYVNKPGKSTVSAEDSNREIADIIIAGRACMVSRLGTSEAACVLNHLEICAISEAFIVSRIHQTFRGARRAWETRIATLLSNNAGFFPTTDECLNKFAQTFIDDFREMDWVGVWGFVPGEEFLIKKYCSSAIRFNPTGLEPYYFRQPWSEHLKGLRVLVIHPFAESIRAQYERREKLFADTRILPDFKLLTIPAVQSLAGNKSRFASWFDALDWMKYEVSKLDFDVALIGAGAYGLPLSAHVKRCGNIAIHLGGALQILFGIKGKRWDNMKEFSDIINEHWVRPAPSEMIPSANKIEDGCYW